MKVTVNISRFWSKNLTVRQVAQDLEMNPRSITALRKGTEKGDWATLVKLSRYFKVPLEELLEVEEDVEPLAFEQSDRTATEPITTDEEVPPLGTETNATEGEQPLSEQVEAEQSAPEAEHGSQS